MPTHICTLLAEIAALLCPLRTLPSILIPQRGGERAAAAAPAAAPRAARLLRLGERRCLLCCRLCVAGNIGLPQCASTVK